MKIVPSDKFDYIACNNLLTASNQEVIENIDSLLEWLQDMNWPVASRVLSRLKLIKEPLTSPVRRILQGDDDIWKYWIITELLSQTSSSVVATLEEDLQRIITKPTENEVLEEVNIAAIDLLNM